MTTVLAEIQQQTQITVEQEEPITADFLFPKWSHYLDLLVRGEGLKAIRWKRKHKLEMGDYHRCIAGEIYGFRNVYDDYEGIHKEYYCKTCSSYADHDFPNLLGEIEEGNIGHKWRNHRIVKNYIKHWERKHNIDNRTGVRHI